MNIEKLSAESERAYGFTHKVTVVAADLTETTADTAQVIPIFPASGSFAIGTIVSAAAYRLPTTFQDASDAAFNSTAITVGDAGDVDRFIVSKELNENGTEIPYWASNASSFPYAYLAADAIDVTFNAMSAKALNDIDTGVLEIFLHVIDLNGLKA